MLVAGTVQMELLRFIKDERFISSPLDFAKGQRSGSTYHSLFRERAFRLLKTATTTEPEKKKSDCFLLVFGSKTVRLCTA
jgi:hypothetical protein